MGKRVKKVTHKRWPLFIGVLLVVLLVAANATTAFFVIKQPLQKIAVANLSPVRNPQHNQLKAAVEEAGANYRLTIAYPNGSSKDFSLSEMGVTLNAEETASRVQAQITHSPLIERLQWWKVKNVPLSLAVDTSALSSFINTNAIQAGTPATNAQLKIENGAVTITEQKPGVGQAIPNASSAILATVSQLTNKPLKLEPGEVSPAITAADLENAKAQIEKILQTQVAFQLQGKTIQPSAVDIGSWIDITPIEAEKTVDITINDGKVASYIEAATRSDVRETRSTVLLTQPDGSTIVISGGQNGVTISNKDSAAAAVAKALEEGSPTTQQLQLAYQSAKSITIPQAYDKWLAVDVTNKRMYAYEKSSPIKTILISAGAPGTPTVLGQYHIYAKYPLQDMRGANTDGSRYFQPSVRWVNYFYKDYAIHGNYWRPTSYFGNINSSHGCVGILDYDGEWIYNWAPINTPVIIYD